MSIGSTSDTDREGSGIASVVSEIERFSKEHQRPQRERNGAPIVLMMLVYVARARTQASSAKWRILFSLGLNFEPRWARPAHAARP